MDWNGNVQTTSQFGTAFDAMAQPSSDLGYFTKAAAGEGPFSSGTATEEKCNSRCCNVHHVPNQWLRSRQETAERFIDCGLRLAISIAESVVRTETARPNSSHSLKFGDSG